MPTAFTDEEMKLIRSKLITAGIRLSRELGIQKMSVEKLSSAVGIAKGSFYLFSAQRRILSLRWWNTQELKLRKCCLLS